MRILNKLLLLVAVVLLMRFAHAALAVGLALLAAYLAGEVARVLRLPKLTGYLAVGLLCGPEILAYLSRPILSELKLVNGVAIALIALTAGGEVNFTTMRPLLRTISAITMVAVVGTALLLTVTLSVIADWLPFFAALEPLSSVAVAATLGCALAAQSPAIVMAIREETRAEGPVAQTVLGVVVVADLVIILLFTISSSIAKATLYRAIDAWGTVRDLGWELFGSIGVGLLAGVLLVVYLRNVGRGLGFVVLAMCFLVTEVGRRVHLDPLLAMLAAGMLVENKSDHGDTLIKSIERFSLPVYMLFFTVAGATIHVRQLGPLLVPIVVLVASRTAGLLAGNWLGSVWVNAPGSVRRYAGFGLLPQAGLAIALGLTLERTFPLIGADASTLVLGVVAFNELVAPAAYRTALLRAGEAKDRDKPPRG